MRLRLGATAGWCWWGAAALLVSGCARPPHVELRQPQLRGPEAELRLTSEQVYWAEGDSTWRVLAEAPLPGASTGRPAYVLYLRQSAGTPGEANDGGKGAGQASPAASQPAAGSAAALRGFLIQTRGANAGRADLVRGRLEVVKASGKWRTYAVDLMFDDGTHLAGQLLARRDDRYLQDFERERRPGDVEALLKSPPTTQPDS